MRLFTAINFDNNVKQSLSNNCNELQKHIVRGNITDKNNFHMTLVFIGEVGTNRLSVIKDAVHTAAENISSMYAKDISRVAVTIQGLNSFARIGEELVWVGVETESDIFYQINKELINSLEKNGIMIKASDKKFTPHVTIARKVEFWRMSSADLSKIDFPPVYTSAKSITLMESVTEKTPVKNSKIYRTKQVYKPIYEVPFV